MPPVASSPVAPPPDSARLADVAPPAPATAAAPSPSPRLESLDAYRGLIMVALAFNGFGLAATARNHLRTEPASGFWSAVQFQFEHVEWVGCSFWDLIQPSFMFMVGVSLAYSCAARLRQGHSRARMFGHACWRGFALAALGIFLISNSRPSTAWSFMNVLTQIGLGYPFLFLLWGRSLRTQALAAAALLLGTWALYAFYPTPGIDPARGNPAAGVPAAWAQQHLAGLDPAWHKNANVGHAVDLALINALPVKEPFAFNSGGYQTINFIPSLATMLFGLMIGELLRSARPASRKLALLAGAGLAGLVAGELLAAAGVPLVKRLWTPSWALYSTGWCCLILAALFAVIDLRGWRRWSFPLLVVGMNSIAIYVMGMLLRGWTAGTFRTHFGADVFNFLGRAWAPFVQATLVGLVFWLVCYWMYRRKIFLRL
jgi:predicted acyltransferase